MALFKNGDYIEALVKYNGYILPGKIYFVTDERNAIVKCNVDSGNISANNNLYTLLDDPSLFKLSTKEAFDNQVHVKVVAGSVKKGDYIVPLTPEKTGGCYLKKDQVYVVYEVFPAYVRCKNLDDTTVPGNGIYYNDFRMAFSNEVPELKEEIDSLVVEAMARYPLGTKFHPAHIGNGGGSFCIVTKDSIFTNTSEKYTKGTKVITLMVNGRGNNESPEYGNNSYERIVYYNGIWAAIVNPEFKKEQLLARATKEYPIGTNYVSASKPHTKAIVGSYFVASGIEGGEYHITDGFGGSVYYDGKWADIIPKSNGTFESLVSQAKKDYPIGTEYKHIKYDTIHIVKDELKYRESTKNITDGNGGSVYDNGVWAQKLPDSLPEYGECIKSDLPGVSLGEVVKCYIDNSFGHKYRWSRTSGKSDGHSKRVDFDKCFKPSTKEAYNAQYTTSSKYKVNDVVNGKHGTGWIKSIKKTSRGINEYFVVHYNHSTALHTGLNHKEDGSDKCTDGHGWYYDESEISLAPRVESITQKNNIQEFEIINSINGELIEKNDVIYF